MVDASSHKSRLVLLGLQLDITAPISEERGDAESLSGGVLTVRLASAILTERFLSFCALRSLTFCCWSAVNLVHTSKLSYLSSTLILCLGDVRGLEAQSERFDCQIYCCHCDHDL
jgi:hypothetical protein